MADGNKQQFSIEIEPYLDKLFRAAYRLTQNRSDAEELVQNTCVRAFTKRDSWANARSPLGWLMRVQYNLFVDGTRQTRSPVVVPISDIDHPALIAGKQFDPEACADDSQQFALVHNAWQKLKKDHRALLALRVEGYTLTEIHEITGIGVDVLNSRLQRARQSLARHLTNDKCTVRARKATEVLR
jgi:RNA polymerase sigma-70 factor (ECF subfamily)